MTWSPRFSKPGQTRAPAPVPAPAPAAAPGSSISHRCGQDRCAPPCWERPAPRRVAKEAKPKKRTLTREKSQTNGKEQGRGRGDGGTGSILFLKKQMNGILYSFGLPGEDEVARMGSGDE